MRLASPAARRPSLLGCVLVGVAALALSACGSDGAATADNTATSAPKQPAENPEAARRTCPAKLGTFVRALDHLRRQLAVGLSYDQYAARMKSLRASYDAILVDRLTIDCLATTGTPGERALNEYVDAANAWGECLDAACTTAAVEPILQRKWRAASTFISEAR